MKPRLLFVVLLTLLLMVIPFAPIAPKELDLPPDTQIDAKEAISCSDGLLVILTYLSSKHDSLVYIVYQLQDNTVIAVVVVKISAGEPMFLVAFVLDSNTGQTREHDTLEHLQQAIGTPCAHAAAILARRKLI